jgi:hypothetical protein
MMKVSISKSNKDVKPQKEFLSKILDNTKPTRLGKSCSELKNCNVNSILQTLKRFDQKYCQKPVKDQEIIPVRNDNLLSTVHGNKKFSSSDTDSRVKHAGKDCRFLSSDIIPPHFRKFISKKELFHMLGNSFTKIEIQFGCIQQGADHSLQALYQK